MRAERKLLLSMGLAVIATNVGDGAAGPCDRRCLGGRAGTDGRYGQRHPIGSCRMILVQEPISIFPIALY